MKKWYLVLLALVLLAGLLIPAFYRYDTATGGLPQQEHKEHQDQGSTASESAAVDTGKTGVTLHGATAPERPVPDSTVSTVGDTTATPGKINENRDSPSPKYTVVGVAVVGKDNKLLYGPAEVSIPVDNSRAVTALDALISTGLPYAVSTRYPDLVVSVSGQQNQGQSGWMYKVNNEIPSLPASKKLVEQGDHIIWWYSQSLSAPSPEWESLGEYE